MPNPPCYHINPLSHGGASQEARLLRELDPAYAPIDDRQLGDLILFAEKYAGLLNYYDSGNKISGDWKSFLSNDITTILSGMAITDYALPVTTHYKYVAKIDPPPGEAIATPTELKNHVKTLFDITATLADTLRTWNDRLVLKSAAKEMIYGEIRSQLAFTFRDLITSYHAAKDNPAENLINPSFSGTPGVEAFPYLDINTVLVHPFRQEWIVTYNPGDVVGDWNNYVNVYLKTPARIAEAKKIFGDAGWTPRNRILYSLSFLKEIFTRTYNAYVRIVTASKKYFEESLNNYPQHSASNGLLLAFLRLFGKAQEALNTFTGKHLDFYYKDVLRLDKKSAVPDAAYVVFTLAHNVDAFVLNKGEQLLAGKDKTGKELIYVAGTTTTFNRSEVAALKTVFFDPAANGGIFAAEVANSVDGKGKPLDKEDPTWFPFGRRQSGLSQPTMTEAEVGFMLAAPVLRLSEGRRTVQADFLTTGNTATSAELLSQFDVWITGRKGWLPCPGPDSNTLTNDNAVKVDGNTLSFRFTLSAAEDAVVPFDPEIHKADYDTEWPSVRIVLKKNADPLLYRKLSKTTVQQIGIKVWVSDAQSAILHSDSGTIENKNPFMPFGARPKLNYNFYVGSWEVFSKKLTRLAIQLNWLGLPNDSLYNLYSYKKDNSYTNYLGIPSDGTKSFKFTTQLRNEGVDANITPSTDSLFSVGNYYMAAPAQTISFTSGLPAAADPHLEPFTTYTPELRRGFVKFTLKGPSAAFGHDAYAKIFTEQVIRVNADAGKNTLPNEPYTPLLQPIKYSYDADESVTLPSGYDRNKIQFFQLFPFGHAEAGGTAPQLMMPFHFEENGIDNDLDGALFVGIRNIAPGQQLSLYFEMLEGSEDASLDVPGIYWSCLQNNKWLPLKNCITADTTNKMLGSGIVTITIPPDANTDNTLMPADLIWLRVAVKNNSGAYPKIYGVYANAAQVRFLDRENDPNHLATPLPAGSIKKMVNSDAAVKKIEQPYDSSGGRVREEGKDYYKRVSERLRHKNRAITIWDYERLTLETFNFLYKAKCLNHTNDTTETAPGCVRLVVIPDMSAKSTGDFFRPSVSNNTRENIRQYLARLNSSFVNLKIENPRYEAVQVHCQVRFRQNLPFDEWSLRLKADIDKFLAPWAFSESRGIEFGGRLHRSQIINYIEKLNYVDYLTDVSLSVEEGGVLTTGLDEVKASTSRSILTSKKTHVIGPNVCLT